MICKPCAIGADALSAALTGPLVAGDLAAATFAQKQHGYCQGCDCQHNVQAQLNGKAIQRCSTRN